jgi:hypothetical protein
LRAYFLPPFSLWKPRDYVDYGGLQGTAGGRASFGGLITPGALDRDVKIPCFYGPILRSKGLETVQLLPLVLSAKSRRITGMSEHRVTNPTGRGGFGDRPQNQWRAKLARGEVTSRCTATSKRSGERCRFPATKGYGVCYWHGARGGYGKFRAPTSKRNLANKEIQRARLWAEAAVAQRVARNEIRPEVYGALKDIIGKIQHRLRLAIDNANERWRQT